MSRTHAAESYARPGLYEGLQRPRQPVRCRAHMPQRAMRAPVYTKGFSDHDSRCDVAHTCRRELCAPRSIRRASATTTAGAMSRTHAAESYARPGLYEGLQRPRQRASMAHRRQTGDAEKLLHQSQVASARAHQFQVLYYVLSSQDALPGGASEAACPRAGM